MWLGRDSTLAHNEGNTRYVSWRVRNAILIIATISRSRHPNGTTDLLLKNKSDLWHNKYFVGSCVTFLSKLRCKRYEMSGSFLQWDTARLEPWSHARRDSLRPYLDIRCIRSIASRRVPPKTNPGQGTRIESKSKCQWVPKFEVWMFHGVENLETAHQG
jgi:hypothetical protein